MMKLVINDFFEVTCPTLAEMCQEEWHLIEPTCLQFDRSHSNNSYKVSRGVGKKCGKNVKEIFF